MTSSPARIPVLDLQPEIREIWDDLNKAFQSVLTSGQFILGPHVDAFEKAAAQYLGCRYALGVNSGTDALVLALRALNLGPGDEVITTPFTFFATSEAIGHVGATPVFVDIEPDTLNISPALVAKAITPRTKAIIPVHLFGHTVDMQPILDLAKRHNLKIVEDVAQAFGATWNGKQVGTIGDVGAYSFFPSKNLGGFGDGGLVTTDQDAIAESVKMLRAHGAKKKYYNEVLGYNSRLDALQAAILSVKLPRIDQQNAGRRRVAALYSAQLAGLEGVTVPVEKPYAKHVYHQYTIRIGGGRRDAVQEALKAAGIETMVYYPVPCHKLPLYRDMHVTLPLAEQAAAEVLSLPIWPQMEEAKVARVVAVLRQSFG